jgi:3-oxoacyl-[acyl-carrier-protein] synthase-1
VAGPTRIWVKAAGLACPLGLGVEAAFWAMRGGLSALGQLAYFDDEGDPIVGGEVELLPGDLSYPERLAELLEAAVADCAGGASPAETVPLALFLGLPRRDRPGPAAGLAAPLSEVLRTALRAPGAQIDVQEEGALAGFRLVERATATIRSGQASEALVCAVDSFLAARVLLWLDGQRRLKTASNPQGVLPGEAAACLWLSRHPPARDCATRVAGVGFGSEEASALNEAPLLGTGLADAARAALKAAGCGFEAVDLRVSDASGEELGFKEQALLLARLLREVKPSVPLWHPAELMGSTGAASGLLQIALADRALAEEGKPGRTVACCTTDDAGARAVAIVRSEGPP